MDQWKKIIGSLSVRQRAMIGVTALAVVLAMVGFSRWRHDADFIPLFTGMAAEDAGAVIQRLKESAVEYRLKEGDGTTILVPSANLAELRLQMAGAGLPKTGRAGFELFDRTNLGTTDFAEHINYARAIEGELERSIRYIKEVEQARVHLTFPKDSVFVESRQPAKASVLLQLKPGSKISSQNVLAICHLVSSAVEGLTPDAVSIVDSRGSLLSKPRKHGPEADMPDDAAEYREKLERDLLGKVQTTLEPLLGADRFRASVAVECDLTSGEEQEERYDPEQTVMLSSTHTEESSGSSSTSGVPGPASSLPRPAKPVAGGNSTMRRSETIGYQPSKTVRHTRIPQGAVKRVSVALLIDHNVRWETKDGKQVRTLVAPPPETLKSVRELVSAVMGLSVERGDQLVVESLPFESTLTAGSISNETAPAPTNARPSWDFLSKLPVELRDVRILAGAGVAAILVLVGLGFGLKKILGRKKAPAPAVGVNSPQKLASGADKLALDSAADDYKKQLETVAEQKRKMLTEAQEKLKAPVHTEKAEVLVGYLRESIQKDATNAATAIRQWLHE